MVNTLYYLNGVFENLGSFLKMQEEIIKERERIKGIVKEKLEADFRGGRLRVETDMHLKPASRQKHLVDLIFFKIDNPNYVRKDKV
jgi:hypothetical protein